MKKILLLFFLILSLGSNALFAFGRRFVGTTGASFIKLGVNARAIGMGEAYSTVSDGADAIYWNPAGLDKVEKQSISLMHAAYFGDIFYDFASYAKRAGKIGTFAVAVQYLNPGSIDQTDEFGTQVGAFKPYHLAASFGWAMKLKERDFIDGDYEFRVGAAVKLIQSKIIESAYAGAIDLGMIWEPMDRLQLGMAAQNIGPDYKFKNGLDHLPLQFKIGSSYQISKPMVLAMDVNFPRDNDLNLGLGAEYKKLVAQDFWIAGRSGFNSRTTPDIGGLSSISAGIGFGWKKSSIDFAWVPFGDLGHTYRTSFNVKF